jgi:F-type H+-transporting ATPase subunit gamma
VQETAKGSSPDQSATRSGSQRVYTFEPDADALFHALLPRYLGARLYAALLDSAAAESAHRQRAMKAATDNANEMILALTLEANQARQSQITEDIIEVSGGAEALRDSSSDDW